MTAAARSDPAGSGPAGTGPVYLRGVRVAEVTTRRVVQVVVALVVAGLVAVTIALAISAAAQNANERLLRDHGVAVSVRVTGCLGISSGVGMGIEYWECRGTYTLGGRSYNETIRGSHPHLADGAAVRAVAVPGHPDLLAAPVVVAGTWSPWTPYITPVVLGALAVLVAGGALRWWNRRPGPTPDEHPPG
jgi:hypothetical protein